MYYAGLSEMGGPMCFTLHLIRFTKAENKGDSFLLFVLDRRAGSREPSIEQGGNFCFLNPSNLIVFGT